MSLGQCFESLRGCVEICMQHIDKEKMAKPLTERVVFLRFLIFEIFRTIITRICDILADSFTPPPPLSELYPLRVTKNIFGHSLTAPTQNRRGGVVTINFVCFTAWPIFRMISISISKSILKFRSICTPIKFNADGSRPNLTWPKLWSRKIQGFTSHVKYDTTNKCMKGLVRILTMQTTKWKGGRCAV